MQTISVTFKTIVLSTEVRVMRRGDIAKKRVKLFVPSYVLYMYDNIASFDSARN